jgi:tRNA threonylcarbamoyladenosine biosynthesis protein TsaB
VTAPVTGATSAGGGAGAILALEASTLHVGVALVGPAGEPWGHREAPAGSRGTALLAQGVRELLDARGLAVRDLLGVAVGTGPGSYTGTRAAIALARALVFATGIRIAGVPSTAAAALSVLRREPAVQRVIVLVDARRGEVYRADYARGPAASATPGASTTPTAVELLAPRLVAGAEAQPPQEEGISVLREPVPDAYDVAAVGRERLLSGGDSPEAVLPLYLKRSHAEIVFDERVGTSRLGGD